MIEFKLMIEFCTHLLITTVGAFLFYFVAVLSHRSWFIEKLPNSFQGIAQAPLQRAITLIIALFLFFSNVFYLSPNYYTSKNKEFAKKSEESALIIQTAKLRDKSVKLALNSRPDVQVQFEKLIKEQLDNEVGSAIYPDDPDYRDKYKNYSNKQTTIEKNICSIFKNKKPYKITNWTGYVHFQLEGNVRERDGSETDFRTLSYEITLPSSWDKNYRNTDKNIALESYGPGLGFGDEHHTIIEERDNILFFKELLKIKKMNKFDGVVQPEDNPVVIFSGQFFSASEFVESESDGCLRRYSDGPSGGSYSSPRFYFKLTDIRLAN